MTDARIGWAIGGLLGMDDHVLRTMDGGITWKDCSPPELATAGSDSKTAIGTFQNTLFAWVTYANRSGSMLAQAIVWHTQDGCETWRASHPLDLSGLRGDYVPSDLQFVSGQFGWLLVHVGVVMNHDYIALFHSQDAGTNWTLLLDQYNTSGIMSCFKTGILFTDATHGWLTGDCHGIANRLYLFRTNDAGATWLPLTLPDPSGAQEQFSNGMTTCGAYHPFFFGKDLGHLSVLCAHYDLTPITYDYFVYTTKDGGNTWTSSDYPGEVLYFFSTDIGWVLSKNIQHTVDGGLTWKIISNVSWSVQVDFVSEQIGWGVARTGELIALVKTTNGGVTWTELTPIVGP